MKSDLLVLTQKAREEKGHVWIFDPSGATGRPSCRGSPLAQVTSWGEALRASRWIADSSKVGGLGVQDSEFWESHGRRCLAPKLYAAANTPGATMVTVNTWVQREEEEDVARILSGLDEPDAVEAWEGHRHLHERTKSSVWATAAQILEAWAHPEVKETVDVSNGSSNRRVFDVDAFVTSTDTLYLVAPASDQQLFRPIFETLVNAILRKVEQLAAATAAPLDPPLMLALDEAANIAPLRRLDQVASKGAGEGLVLIDVWQDEGQVRNQYGDDVARTIMANHFAKVYMSGIADHDTLRTLSDQIGDDQVTRRSTTLSREGGRSISTSQTDIRVAPPEEIRELAPNQGIVLIGRYKPIRVTLPGWWEDKKTRELIDPAVAAAFDNRFAKPSKKGHRK